MTINKRQWMTVSAALLLVSLGVLWVLHRDERKAPPLGQFITDLPAARITPHPGWTKLDYYKQADLDSAKRKAEQTRDPYNVLPELGKPSADAQADAVTRQLQVLQQALDRPAPVHVKSTASYLPRTSSSGVSSDVQKFETMLHQLKPHDAAVDPKLQQLGELLDKIKDIQHPEQVTTTVASGDGYAAVSAAAASHDGFYTLSEDTVATTENQAFSAVIDAAQTLTSGSLIKLRLSQDILINRHRLPLDTPVWGIAQLHGERLLIDIRHVRAGEVLLPVKLAVFDADGLPGIYIPGSLTRDVVKPSAAQSMSSLGLRSFEPSVGAQVASAGMQAAKFLLQKKVQLVRVNVPAGYQVFLQNQ